MAEKQSEAVGLGRAIRNFYVNYGIFSGRSSRSEYWYIWLYSVLLYFAGAVPLVFLPSIEAQFSALTVWPAVVGLAHFVPSLALIVRRLRDAGFSPYLSFLLLAPFGGLALIVLAFFDSKSAPESTSAPSIEKPSDIEAEIRRLDDLHRQGLIDDKQLREAKNKALGI
jgi:uncharacterized membrane protein YhaH (DUF805 family)